MWSPLLAVVLLIPALSPFDENQETVASALGTPSTLAVQLREEIPRDLGLVWTTNSHPKLARFVEATAPLRDKFDAIPNLLPAIGGRPPLDDLGLELETGIGLRCVFDSSQALAWRAGASEVEIVVAYQRMLRGLESWLAVPIFLGQATYMRMYQTTSESLFRSAAAGRITPATGLALFGQLDRLSRRETSAQLECLTFTAAFARAMMRRFSDADGNWNSGIDTIMYATICRAGRDEDAALIRAAKARISPAEFAKSYDRLVDRARYYLKQSESMSPADRLADLRALKSRCIQWARDVEPFDIAFVENIDLFLERWHAHRAQRAIVSAIIGAIQRGLPLSNPDLWLVDAADPFNPGQPLRLARDASGDWIVYSIGTDQVDDLGDCRREGDADILVMRSSASATEER